MSGDGSAVIARLGSAPGPTLTLYRNPGLTQLPHEVTCPFSLTATGDLRLLPELLMQAAAVARTEAARAGATRAALVGPMAGSTWAAYRVAETACGEHFPGDVSNPPAVAAALRASGMSCTQTYYSYQITNDGLQAAVAAGLPSRPRRQLRLESVPAREFADRLPELFPLVAEAFAGNVLATPITRAGFVSAYTPLARVAGDGWLQLGYVGRTVVGFALLPRTDQLGGTSVLKTLARRPGRVLSTLGIAPARLGAELAHLTCEALVARGDARIVMALMHADNPSLGLAQSLGATCFKRYGLYRLDLDVGHQNAQG